MGVVRYNGIGMVTEDEFNTGLAGKLDKPDVEGTEGQVLTKTAGGDEEWATIPETGRPADSEMKDDSTNAVQNQVIKAYVDNGDATLDAQKANKDGYYEQLVSGAAKNLEAPITVSGAFLTRPTGGEGAEVADGVAQILEAEGKSVKFNQLCAIPASDISDTKANVQVTDNRDGSYTLNGTANGLGVFNLYNPSFIAGHSYLLRISGNNGDALTDVSNISNWYSGTETDSARIIKCKTSNSNNVELFYRSGASFTNITVFVSILDLTAMGIDSLTTVEEVEAWLAENIGAMAYYPYTAGTVLNNCMEGIEAPGYNLLDPATGKAVIIGAYSDLYGNYYGIVGTHGALTFTDAYGNESTITPDADGKFELTVPGELSVASAGADCAVFLWWDGTKKEYEPYELNHGYLDVTHIYGKLNGAGDLVQVYAAGMARVGDNKDYLHNVDGSAVADKVIGSRAYTSGDESDSTVITDGTTTYYHLTTELRYTNLVYQGSSYYADGTPVVLPVNYKVSNWSIESILPKNTSSALVTAPAALTCKYSLGAVDLLNTHTDEIADLYDKKADKDGTYPELISGNLIDGNGVGTDQEIMFRPTGGGAALAGNSNAIIQAIKGRTLKWNALWDAANNTGNIGVERNGITVDYDTTTEKYRVHGTSTGYDMSICKVDMVNGHKYAFISSSNFTGPGTTKRLYIDTGVGSFQANSINTFSQTSGSKSIYCAIGSGETVDFYFYIQILDLTEMFGAGNKPATVSDFTALFPNFPYAYNAGTLLPFKGTGLRVAGFNQWDEQWENGEYNTTTGEKTGSTYVRTKNFIPVIPGQTYYFYKGSNWANVRVFYYDINKNYLGLDYYNNQSGFSHTVASGVYFITFYTWSDTTYNHDICINLSNASLNGTYKPYTETLVNIDAIGKSAKDADGNAIVPFPTGVNSVGGNNDWYGKENGAVQIFEVDASQLSWTLRSTGTNNKGWSTTGPLQYIANKGISERYIFGGTTTGSAIENNGADSYLKDSFYTFTSDDRLIYVITGVNDTPQGKIQLVRSTPVPFTWDTPLDLIYPAPAGGTEMLLPQGVDESGVPATTPMDATIFYSKDYVQTINDMPKDYDTIGSMDSFTAGLATMLSTALDGTVTITRGSYDESTKKYSWGFTFTPNAEEE